MPVAPAGDLPVQVFEWPQKNPASFMKRRGVKAVEREVRTVHVAAGEP